VSTVDPHALKRAIARTRDYLLEQQHPDGYWVAELESDVSVTAGYIPFMHYLGVDVGDRERKVLQTLRDAQLPEGGWGSYWGGPGNLDVSIQAYLSLKLLGRSASEPMMERARAFILAQGGIERANTFTKIMLALFGQYDWARLPSLPPELLLLPNWFPITIYDFASWARATIVALSVVIAHRPVHSLSEAQALHELTLEPGGASGSSRDPLWSWETGFRVTDRVLKAWERVPCKPGRARALREAERWILAHQDRDGSWGGIMLPWVYSLVALRCLGYANDHPAMARGLEGMEGFIVEEDDTMRLQPAVSPVWDTAYATIALREAGLPPDHPALVQAAGWLLEKQVLCGGDWQVKRPHAEPGGWAFEFENDRYPDIDDSVLVPMALLTVQTPDPDRKREAVARAVDWVLDMQSRQGGWAAFDVDNDMEMLAHIPFADFMTPLDPVSVDVTAHVVELLGRLEYDAAHSALQHAVTYLRREQQENGTWFGRWGVNYIYGTAAVLMALREIGEDPEGDAVRRAVRWLKQHQDQDGGWGESCRSYEDPSLQGVGPSTASQTAWALLGLLAAGEARDSAVHSGIAYLLGTQQSDGHWDEPFFTGAGFPGAFYLKYHMYPIYFPLIALARYQKMTQEGDT
jgi:squalene-hopene/tetraprenyl-beta-curcumene cyclase